MRICDNCGAEYDSREEYCPECGMPVDKEPVDRNEESNTHLKTCPQCGEYLPLETETCPSCGYVFYKKRNTKLYIMIGAGVIVIAAIVAAIILLTNRKPAEVEIAATATPEPISIVTVAPTEESDVTATEAPAATEVPAANSEILSEHRDEAATVFELLETAADGEEAVTVYSLDGTAKSVSVATAESYVTKLLSLAFGSKAGFEYNFYKSDDAWNLVMSGTLNADQITKMLALEDSNIYATFRSMYLNTARDVISAAVGAQPVIMLSVYETGKSDDDYALRIVESTAGDGTVTRAENA